MNRADLEAVRKRKRSIVLVDGFHLTVHIDTHTGLGNRVLLNAIHYERIEVLLRGSVHGLQIGQYLNLIFSIGRLPVSQHKLHFARSRIGTGYKRNRLIPACRGGSEADKHPVSIIARRAIHDRRHLRIRGERCATVRCLLEVEFLIAACISRSKRCPRTFRIHGSCVRTNACIDPVELVVPHPMVACVGAIDRCRASERTNIVFPRG